MTATVERLKDARDVLLAAATAWKKEVEHRGIRLSLDGAAPRTRYALMSRYETTDATLADKLLSPQDKVLDVGAASGFLSLHCLKNIGVAECVMVEANPALRPLIERNFALNNVLIPALFECAVGPADAHASFNVARSYISSSLLDHPRAATACEVPMKTLPTIISELSFAPTALLMDIEGAEKDIPLDHLGLFEKIVIEFHDRYIGSEAVSIIADGLVARGYTEIARAGFSRAYSRHG